MKSPAGWIILLLLVPQCTSSCAHLSVRPPQKRIEAPSQPPAPPREVRAAWVATVGNIDWPSAPGLATERQLREMTEILDRASELRLNALILQVRPAGDALYASAIEPWSYYLTGEEGKAPDPYYDPLATWVRHAHQRGIEIHAWFNPYRAKHGEAKYVHAPSHVTRSRVSLVRRFNDWEWLDPGEPEVRRYTTSVILDVVRRYDIDGVHLDDYFYPYAEYLKGQDFPDEPSWTRYLQADGTVSRGDWRRDNVNTLVRELYAAIKTQKPWVKFGISPFGIWRPGHPHGVTGLDAYDRLFADARLWLNRGWLDYCAPQLYWPAASKGQPYARLLQWWVEQNTQGRHIWPGNYTSRVHQGPKPWPVDEILEQIRITRAQPGAGGNIHFSARSLMSEKSPIASSLRSAPYAHDALVPPSPWLGSAPPPPPHVFVDRGLSSRVTWSSPEGAAGKPWLWGVWTRQGTAWEFQVVPASVTEFHPASAVEVVAVIAVDRLGNASEPVLVKLSNSRP